MSTLTSVITVVIADDHPLFREALRQLLESDPKVRVVGSAGNGRDAIALVKARRPDILLLDLRMPDTPGLTTLRELAALSLPVRTLVLAADVGNHDVVDALQLGARGVLMKHAATDMLFESIHAVMAGHYWVGRDCVQELIENMCASEGSRGSAKSQPTFDLTARQLDIVSAIVMGATNDDIAKQFSISPHTVKYHLTNMFEKLGVSNRIELACFAIEHRLTDNVQA
jgi:DNA-binding NarL/FixJ family response regulator